MKFFRKPAVAVIITIIVVIATTLLSFEIRFGNKCQEIVDGFHEGIYFNGEMQPSCASRLKNIIEYANEIRAIANTQGEDTEELAEFIEYLDSSLRYSSSYVSGVYYNYADVMNELTELKTRLATKELSPDISSKLDELYSAINLEKQGLETSGYNESVRAFLREYDRFPVSTLWWYTDVIMPDYFGI